MFLMIATDPTTGAISAIPAGRLTATRRAMFEAAAQAQGLEVTWEWR